MNTLKDYAVKALVNTVDHLGSVSYKVDDLLNEKVDEVSASEIRVSCIEQVSFEWRDNRYHQFNNNIFLQSQRVQACQDYIDHQGLSQQTLLISTPKYHKRYILPGILLFLFYHIHITLLYFRTVEKSAFSPFLSVGVSMPESGRQATAVCQEIDVLEENYESEQFQAGNVELMLSVPCFWTLEV